MKNLSCHSEECGAFFCDDEESAVFFDSAKNLCFSLASAPQISAARNRRSSCRSRRIVWNATLRGLLRGMELFLLTAVRAGNFQQKFPATRLRDPEAASDAETAKYRKSRIRLSAIAPSNPRLSENTKG